MHTRSFIVMLAFSVAAISFSGCKNAFEEFANKESDEALLYEANKLADQRRWSEAIEKMLEMSEAAQAKRENKLTLASFYGGRCGLDLLSLAEDVKDGLEANQMLFPILSQAMSGSRISDADDCETAEETIQSISEDAEERTSDENIVLALIEFAKIGAVLVSSGADTDADGDLDLNHTQACDLDTVPSGQTVSPAQRVGAGITNAVASLAASGSDIAGDAVTSVNALCAEIDDLPGIDNFCTQYKPTDFTGVELNAIMSLIQSNEVGYNECGGTVDSAGCLCL